MPTRTALRVSAMVVALVGLLLLPGTAQAQYPPAPRDFVSCTPAPARPGDTVSCTGGVFRADSDVDLLVTASTLLDSSATADSNGVVALSFAIPDAHKPGIYKVTLTGIGPNGQAKIVTGTGVIAAAAPAGQNNGGAGAGGGGRLAFTGTNALLIGLLAVGALTLGGGALVATRRRRQVRV